MVVAFIKFAGVLRDQRLAIGIERHDDRQAILCWFPLSLVIGRVVIFVDIHDVSFDEAGFWQLHAFAGAVSVWPDEFKNEMVGRMQTAVAQLPGIWQELPQVWLHPHGHVGTPAELDFAAVRHSLERFQRNPEKFWAKQK